MLGCDGPDCPAGIVDSGLFAADGGVRGFGVATAATLVVVLGAATAASAALGFGAESGWPADPSSGLLMPETSGVVRDERAESAAGVGFASAGFVGGRPRVRTGAAGAPDQR